MPKKRTGLEARATGVVEGIEGKVKEAGGAIIGNDDLRNEGRAQEHMANSEREVARKEAEADKARAAVA